MNPPYETQWFAEEMLAMTCMVIGMVSNVSPLWSSYHNNNNNTNNTVSSSAKNYDQEQQQQLSNNNNNNTSSSSTSRRRRKKTSKQTSATTLVLAPYPYYKDQEEEDSSSDECYLWFCGYMYILSGSWQDVKIHTVKRQLAALCPGMTPQLFRLIVNGVVCDDDTASGSDVGFSPTAVIEAQCRCAECTPPAQQPTITTTTSDAFDAYSESSSVGCGCDTPTPTPSPPPSLMVIPTTAAASFASSNTMMAASFESSTFSSSSFDTIRSEGVLLGSFASTAECGDAKPTRRWRHDPYGVDQRHDY
eukprot:PhF_6_TR6888/c2_g1_i1/m.9960